MKLDWTSQTKGTIIGNSLGYGLANKRLKEAVSKYVEFDDGADVAVHFCHPQHYEPNWTKRKNFLFTMCEHEWLSDDFYMAFARCDAIFTPSEYCKKIFEKEQCGVPVYVVPLGVDDKVFRTKKRRWKGPRKEKFRFIYIGAPNIRKYSLLEEVYRDIIHDLPGVELYIKTTGADLQGEDAGTNFIKRDGWTLDNRLVSEKSLVDLYLSAHCKLFLHMGEGFGLPALESLATGLPLIVSDYAATSEFCNRRNAFPVKCNPGTVDAMIQSLDGGEVSEGGIVKVDTMIPDKASIFKAMYEVMSNYEDAQDRARQGAKDAKKMTWDHSAKKMLDILHLIDSPPSET